MGKIRAITKPNDLSKIVGNSFYDEISRDWQFKAKQLQARRWRALKTQQNFEFRFKGELI